MKASGFSYGYRVGWRYSAKAPWLSGAWLLPKMMTLGGVAWAVNGAAFALYHTFQLWLLPQLIPLSLFMAFVVYYTRSIWPALLFHLAVNSLSVGAIIYLIVS